MTSAQALDAMGFWKPLSNREEHQPSGVADPEFICTEYCAPRLEHVWVEDEEDVPYAVWVECKVSLIYRGSQGTSRGQEDENKP